MYGEYKREIYHIKESELRTFLHDAVYVICDFGYLYEVNCNMVEDGLRGAILRVNNGYVWAYQITHKVINI